MTQNDRKIKTHFKRREKVAELSFKEIYQTVGKTLNTVVHGSSLYNSETIVSRLNSQQLRKPKMHTDVFQVICVD